MVKLYRMNDGTVVLSKNGTDKSFQTPVEAMVFAVEAYEIPASEFIYGYTQLDINNHNSADFGVFGGFIFSEKVDLNKVWVM